MVNNAVKVIISIKHLNISINKSVFSILINKKQLNESAEKHISFFKDWSNAISAWKDKKFLDCYGFTFGELWPGSL